MRIGYGSFSKRPVPRDFSDYSTNLLSAVLNMNLSEGGKIPIAVSKNSRDCLREPGGGELFIKNHVAKPQSFAILCVLDLLSTTYFGVQWNKNIRFSRGEYFQNRGSPSPAYHQVCHCE